MPEIVVGNIFNFGYRAKETAVCHSSLLFSILSADALVCFGINCVSLCVCRQIGLFWLRASPRLDMCHFKWFIIKNGNDGHVPNALA